MIVKSKFIDVEIDVEISIFNSIDMPLIKTGMFIWCLYIHFYGCYNSDLFEGLMLYP